MRIDGLEIASLESDRPFKARIRFMEAAKRAQGQAEMEVRLGGARIQRDRTRDQLGGGLPIPGLDPQKTEIVPGSGVLRIFREKISVRTFCLGESPRHVNPTADSRSIGIGFYYRSLGGPSY